MGFRNYMPGVDLDSTVRAEAVRLGVRSADIEAAFSFLAPLGLKGQGGAYHRSHSLRVALVATRIARQLREDGALPGVDVLGDRLSDRSELHVERAMLLAGMLHDVGKALVRGSTLCATDAWTAEDAARMEGHALDSFRLLQDRFDFTAQVVVQHHRFQKHAYPDKLPEPSRPLSPETLAYAEELGRFLMLADVFDALHRVNSGTVVAAGVPGVALADEEIKNRMISLDARSERLYDAGVFDFGGTP